MSWGAPPQGNYPGGYGQNPPPPATYVPPRGNQQQVPRQPAYAPGYTGGAAPGGYNPAGGYGAAPPMYGGAQGYSAPPQGPPPGVKPELWSWFQTVDADHSGQITVDELRQALMNGNWSPFNPETCRLMIGMFDRNHSGTIDVHEFAALWKYIEDWKACFDRFDRDRSGNIDGAELHQSFQTFGYNLSPNFVNLCLRVFDRNSTSTMNFDDFIQCSVMLKTLTDQFCAKDVHQRGIIQLQYEEFLSMVLCNDVV